MQNQSIQQNAARVLFSDSHQNMLEDIGGLWFSHYSIFP
jgi:hypothetical protein